MSSTPDDAVPPADPSWPWLREQPEKGSTDRPGDARRDTPPRPMPSLDLGHRATTGDDAGRTVARPMPAAGTGGAPPQAPSAAPEPPGEPAHLAPALPLPPETTVFCAGCDDHYAISAVQVKSGEGEFLGTFTELGLSIDVVHSRWSFRRRRRSEQRIHHLDRKADRKLVAQGAWLSCPLDHALPPNLEHSHVIAVLGETGSSKSHYLAALVRVLDEGDTGNDDVHLAAVNDDARDLLRNEASTVFVHRTCLPKTIRTRGPFIFELTVGVAYGGGDTKVISFYDVPGEAFRHEADQVEMATHAISAAAFIFLVDPTSIPELGLTAFKPPLMPEPANGDVVNALAMVLRRLGTLRRGELGRPFVIAVSKADLLLLSDPARELLGDALVARLSDPAAGSSSHMDDTIRDLLLATSARGIVRAAETQFGRANVRYSMMSACGQPAADEQFVDPRSLLVCEPFFDVLDGLGWLRLR